MLSDFLCIRETEKEKKIFHIAVLRNKYNLCTYVWLGLTVEILILVLLVADVLWSCV